MNSKLTNILRNKFSDNKNLCNFLIELAGRSKT